MFFQEFFVFFIHMSFGGFLITCLSPDAKGSRGPRSHPLLASVGPRKEDLCQRCGSLPVLLAASAVRSQKQYLRQEIAWSRQPEIRSSLSSLRADTPGKFVLSRSM